MNKLNKLITLALVAAGIIALAPSAKAEFHEEYVIETDNAFDTYYNPFAKPINIQNWLWDLTRHHHWTNSFGMFNPKDGTLNQPITSGYKKFWQQGNWLLGTDTFATTNRSISTLNTYIKKQKYQKAPYVEKTCLDNIENAAVPTADAAVKDKDYSSENVMAILTVAATKFFRQHESKYDPIANTERQTNAAFMSNLVDQVVQVPSRNTNSYQTCHLSSWQCGQRLDMISLRPGEKCLDFNRSQHTVNKLVDYTANHYVAGIDECLKYLTQIPDDWKGDCFLPNRTNETVLAVDKNAVWRWFDEDVYLDRADVKMLQFFCYMSKVLLLIPKMYEVTGDNTTEKNQLYDVQEFLFSDSKGPIHCDPEMLYSKGGPGEYGVTNYFYPQAAISRQYYFDKNPYNLPYDTFLYGSRVEKGFWAVLQKAPSMFATIDDEQAAAAAKDAFTKALACYLDADAFIKCEWPSVTGSMAGGSRDTNKRHLIELDFDGDEQAQGGDASVAYKGNAAAWRQLIRTLYASMTAKDGTTAQDLDLNALGKEFCMRHKGELVDFSGLGANKDGVIKIDATKVFEGGLRRTMLKDDKAIGLYTNETVTLPGVCVGQYTNRVEGGLYEKTNWYPVPFNNVNTRFLVTDKTVDKTLGGMIPNGTAIDDLRTMANRYSMTARGATEFAEHFYDERTVLATGQSTNLVENKVYTAVKTETSGGVFSLLRGATLTGTNVAFEGNKAMTGGAISNNGTVALTNATFTGNTATQNGGAISSNGTLSLDGVTFEGNTANCGGAIHTYSMGRGGTVNFDGPVMLVTASDTIFNDNGALNWNLAGGKAGFLDGYDKISNSVSSRVKMRLTVEECTAIPTNIVIATGEFSNIEVMNTDTFSITNATLGGWPATGAKINGGFVGISGSKLGYKLFTEPDPESGTTNLVLHIEEHYNCAREELNDGDTKTLESGKTYTAAPEAGAGGAFFVSEGATLTGTGVVFKDNDANYGGAIENGGTVALTNATFIGNKAWLYGGAIENTGTLSLDGVTFEGNTAEVGGAIINEGTVHFDGAVTLVTTNDTIYNLMATLNWNLAGGKQGLLNGYDKLSNDRGTLQLTVGDYAATTNFTIATGNFSGIATAKTDTFSITNVLGGAALPGLKINGDTVYSADGKAGYKLVTVEDLDAVPPTTNLVLQVIKYTCTRAVVKTSPENPGEVQSPYALTNGFTYTAKPVTKDGGGAFAVGTGATLTGTNVTFEANETTESGGAIENFGGTVALTNAVFKGNKATKKGGAIYNLVTPSGDRGTLSLDGVTFEGNTAKNVGGAIYNNEATVHFDGPVMLVTTNDTIRNYKGTLNWNLAGGKAGLLNGYENISCGGNNAKLQLTVENYAATTNFTIATGDFSGIATAKTDTFTITNVLGGAALPAKIGGNAVLAEGGLAYSLKKVGTNLVLNVFKPVCKLVTNGGMTTNYFATVAEAVKATSGSSNDITLLGDADTAGVEANSNYFKLDMNGHSLTNVGCSITGIGAMISILNTGATGGLVNKGTINVTTSEGFLDLSSLAWGEGGLIPGSEGALAIASGATVKLNAANNTPNWMVANNPAFLSQCAVGAKVGIGTTTYTLQASGIWTTSIDSAAATVIGQASAECGGTNIVYNALFKDLQKAVDAVMTNGTVTLVNNIFLANDYINVEDRPAFTLDLNGYGVASIYDGNMLQVRSPLTILDSSKDQKGSIVNANTTEPAVYATTNLWIESGTIAGNDNASALVAVDSAAVEISGGTVKNGLAAYGSAAISITGGTFVNRKPAASYVAEGYACYQTGEKEWTVAEGAKLSDVELVDKSTEPWTTNATAVVKVGDYPVDPNADGTYTVPKGYEITLEYQATDDYMFGPGWKTKTVELGELEGDTSMNDEPYASLKPSTQEKWVDVREIAVDTRERIVVGSPNEVLPIAYSTNGWGWAKAPMAYDPPYEVQLGVDGKILLTTNQNGYAEWMPEVGAYGKYDVWQTWLAQGMSKGSTNATIYYSGYFPLTLVKPKNGTYEAKVAGVAITNGTPVLGYEYVNLKATPTYDNANRYEFVGWAATTGGVVFAEGFTNTATAVTRFEMPNCAAAIAAGFQWKSNYNEQVVVKIGESWQVFAGETYSNMYGSAMHNMGHAYGSGATFSDSKTPLSGSAIYTEGTFAFTNVTFKGNETALESGGALRVEIGSTGILVRCAFEGNKAAFAGGAICSDGRLTLEDCYFALNDAPVGGALCNYAGAEVVLRGTNTFETNYDTVFNGGKLVWDFTDGSFPCFKGYLFFTNAVEGTLWIRTVDDLKTGVYTIATGVVGSTTGKDTFTITNGTSTNDCKVVEEKDLETTDWTYVGAKRFKLYVDNGEIKLLVQPAVLRSIAVAADPVAAGTAKATTNGVVVTSVYADTVVTVTATTNLYWQFDEWTGVDAAGNALTFEEPEAAETTFKMVDTNVTVTANFIVSEAYKFQTAQAISNAADNAIAAIDAKNLSEEEKKFFNDQIREDRDAQVAAVGAAAVPAYVAVARAVAIEKFEVTKQAAQECADRTWAIESVVAYTNVAGTVSVTNESQARLDVAIAATTNLNWQFTHWTVVDAEGKALDVAEPTEMETTFTMPETNVTVTANFIVSEAYKAALTAATKAEKDKADQSLEALRNNRLTDEECDAALLKVQQDYDGATNKIATAGVPVDAFNAADTAKKAFDKTTKAAEKESAAKPFEFVIASDFSANPPFEPVETNAFGEVTVFAWNDQVWTNGVNAFTTFTAMQENETLGAFATNLHVFGAQTIADDLTMANTWNLDLVPYQDEAGDDVLPIVTVGKKDDGELADITEKLGLITGEGEIVLGKTDADPSIYDDYIVDKDKVGVVNAGSEQKKDPQSGKITVDVDETAKAETTESGKTAVVVAGVENASGDIVLTVERTATNDVVVAGNVQATVGNVTISNASTNEMTVAGTVSGIDVAISNLGKADDAEGSIFMAKVEASGDVTIENRAHLEANVAALGKITIWNRSPNTIVGTYDGSEVSIDGDSAGAISNVTFVSDGPVALTGVNVLTGPFAIEAPAGAVTNFGQLVWNVRGGNATATLADFDAVATNAQAQTSEIWIDAAPADGVFTLAKNAAGADGQSFTIKGYAAAQVQTAIVNGPMLYPGAKAFMLELNAANELVLTISDGKFDVTVTADQGGAAAAVGGVEDGQAIVGTTVTVSATPADLWQFKAWTGNAPFACTASATTAFKMPTHAVSVTATFEVSTAYRSACEEKLRANHLAAIRALGNLPLSDSERALCLADVEAAFDAALRAVRNAGTPTLVGDAVRLAEHAFGKAVEDAAETAKGRVAAWDVGAVLAPAVRAELMVDGDLLVSGVGPMKDFDEEGAPWADAAYVSNLVEAVVSSNVTYVGSYAFADCTALKFLDLSEVAEFPVPFFGTNVFVGTEGVMIKLGSPEAYKVLSADPSYLALDPCPAIQAPPVPFEFLVNDITATEGEEFEVVVFGGKVDRTTSVTLNFVKGTYTSKPTAYVDGRKVSFPVTLDFARGEIREKTVTLVTKKSSKADEDKFFTLQLSAPAGNEVGEKQVATVTVEDAKLPVESETAYVRALAWPANGGTVSGAGALGNAKSALTLKAKAKKKVGTFAGWYLAKTNDVNQIDLENGFVTFEANLKVGYGTEYGEGTYYAYFTDVLPVASVVDPDETSALAEGVTYEDGAYCFKVGVYAQLPVELDDESGKGSLTVSSLPSGLKYNKKTGLIYGTPTKAGVKAVKAVAKNAAGKQTVYYAFDVEALPAEAVGTWNGLVRQLEDAEGATHAGFGSVQFTASSSGKLSAKVTTRLTGTKSFSAKSYELVDENVYAVLMETSKGEVFSAKLYLTNDWKTAQLFGTVTGGAFEANDEEVEFSAIRNAFVKKDGNEEALDLLAAYKGTYVDALYLAKGGAEAGSVTFKVQNDGKVQVKAYSANGTYSATCAGAFRATPTDQGAVQAAIRCSARLWAADALLDAETGDISGLACDYDAEGDDTHETIGVPANGEIRIR